MGRVSGWAIAVVAGKGVAVSTGTTQSLAGAGAAWGDGGVMAAADAVSPSMTVAIERIAAVGAALERVVETVVETTVGTRITGSTN